jgi:hypothetical protein
MNMKVGLQAKDDDSLSNKSQEKEFENTKSLCTLEITVLSLLGVIIGIKKSFITEVVIIFNV